MNKRVLVIDDEPVLTHVIGEILLRDNYVVSAGSNGRDLDRLLAEHDDVIAIICDMTMPFENGIHIHRRLRELLKARGIVFILFHGMHSDYIDAVSDYLQRHPEVAEIRKMHQGLTIYHETILRLRAAL